MTDVRNTPDLASVPVDIRVPADPSMSKVVRLAASGVASLLNFTVAEIEDIKLAVSEVLIALVEHGAGEPVDVHFLVDQDSFSIEGSTAVDAAFDAEHDDLQLCRVVLGEICTEHGLEVVGGAARISATLRRPFKAC